MPPKKQNKKSQPEKPIKKAKYDESSRSSSAELKELKVNKKIKKQEVSGRKKKDSKVVIEIELTESKPALKKGKPGKQKKASGLNLNYYPQDRDQNFPDHLDVNLLKVIASFSNKAHLNDLNENIQRFYQNKVIPGRLYNQLKSFEQESVIFEKDGVYSVHQAFLPPPPSVKKVVHEEEIVVKEQEQEQEEEERQDPFEFDDRKDQYNESSQFMFHTVKDKDLVDPVSGDDKIFGSENLGLM